MVVSKIFAWVKANKLETVLILLIGWLVWKNYRPQPRLYTSVGVGGLEKASSLIPPIESPPAPEVQNRLVVKESTLSLLVKKVAETQKAIQQKAEDLGGYLVDSSISQPEPGEAITGSITIRVPQVKLEETLDYLRTLAVRVVSENISGQDVTDEYVDIDARLATLLKTKTKFEEILIKAEKVEDILAVQRELISLQQQIDNLKGQQQYLEKSAENSRVTAYLSTDELELPYAPSQAWRPKVIFKQATRSLIASIRKLGSALIWLAVYSVIWLPILLIYWLLRRRKK